MRRALGESLTKKASSTWNSRLGRVKGDATIAAFTPHTVFNQPPWLSQTRSKKTTTTVKLSDLPQGPIVAETPPMEAAKPPPSYPTVVLQARQNMQKFDNCVLLTRVGGFYELYFEHAEEFGPLLNLKVASKKTSAGPVPMAGFPFFQLDRYLKILVQDMNRYVAIAEEYPVTKLKSGDLMHDRRVARIITPGTLIDENFIDPYSNNYIMAVHVGHPDIGPAIQDSTIRQETLAPLKREPLLLLGIAWLDLSTGHFYTQTAPLSSLSAVLSRISPREIVLDQTLAAQGKHQLFSILGEDRHLITHTTSGGLQNISDWTPFLESEVPEASQKNFTEQEIGAGNLILNYVEDRLQGLSLKLQPPLRQENRQVMNIDRNTLRALEIKQTMRDGFFRGSLLHAIRRTVTKSGARLLNDWLVTPSTSLEVIKTRQDVVAHFIQEDVLRESISILLQRTSDSHRLVQKFALGRGDPDDLLAVANTIQATMEIRAQLEGAIAASSSDPRDCISILNSRLSLAEPLKLAARIREAVDEEGLTQQHEAESSEADQMVTLAQDVVASEGSQEDASILPKGKRKRPISIKEYYGEDNSPWIMKPAASRSLTKFHAELDQLIADKVSLNENLRERLNAPSLTLKWTPGLGHIAHIKGKDAKNLEGVRALSSSRSTRSFHIQEWSTLGQRMDVVRSRIRNEEQDVFQSLREQVVLNLVKLRRNATVLDELDVTVSFAKLAIEQKLVRPILNETNAHKIIGGRHPTVEGGLFEQGRGFVRNDCLVGSPSHGKLWLITGPNMAGKSTFLRQNALLTILAQIGCYVPASFAELGIVDAIFSRVGSADDLYRDQSTFMVEMLETAQILRNATSRSFVVMDEIGRGTTPEDGTAIAYACLHHLVTVNGCRTLFATHFHAIADLAAEAGLYTPQEGAVQMYYTDVDEDQNGGFVYVHKLQKGINRQSHALKVAKLAGLPEGAIRLAQQVAEVSVGKFDHETKTKSSATG